MPTPERIARALELAQRGTVDGEYHKAWIIDQMVRALTGCPMVARHAQDVRGDAYTYEAQGESEEYRAWLRQFDAGEWDAGIAP